MEPDERKSQGNRKGGKGSLLDTGGMDRARADRAESQDRQIRAAVVLNDKNVVELKNLIRLRKGGLSLQRARHLMEDLRAAGYNPLSRGVFIVLDGWKGRVLRISTDKRAAREILRPHKGQYVMIELLPESGAKEAAQQ